MGFGPTATVAVTVLVAVSITETLLEPLLVMYANGVACAAGAGSKSRLRTAERESNVALNFLNRIPMPDITSPEDCFGYSARKPEVSPRS